MILEDLAEVFHRRKRRDDVVSRLMTGHFVPPFQALGEKGG